jgi:hypothetical protein
MFAPQCDRRDNNGHRDLFLPTSSEAPGSMLNTTEPDGATSTSCGKPWDGLYRLGILLVDPCPIASKIALVLFNSISEGNYGFKRFDNRSPIVLLLRI